MSVCVMGIGLAELTGWVAVATVEVASASGVALGGAVVSVDAANAVSLVGGVVAFELSPTMGVVVAGVEPSTLTPADTTLLLELLTVS
jgi:hypothetical protein